ncbi:SCP-2 sterol transfer family protein [Mycobacterium paraense]|uniref:SCP-2 sterol transfer family protein n=1 Tax=Mycobacterium paraense TaxID=767916 RepID=A0ABX3VI56_9MYCO|nr:SCP-2 sterol transfer family protein [Mycobacterium paraense]ORW29188.1 SCP-2 sterol transfer family protein [Mycobacterium paraense]ORW40347.1 SCP-2 sterol transfer family protein [Mycobacterium paraense]
MAERVSSLLRRSVGHLEDEVPDSYRLLVSRIGPMVVELDVDGEVFSLRGGQRLQVSDGAAQTPSVRIVTSRAGILDLLDARVGLDEAVEAGTVWVGGSLDDVQRAHDSLLAYVHAAVRAPTQPGLLSELREGA